MSVGAGTTGRKGEGKMARTYRKAYMTQGAGVEVIADRVKRGFTQGYKEYRDEQAARRRRVEEALVILWWLEAMD